METILGLDLSFVAFVLSGLLGVACIGALMGFGNFQ